MVGSATGPLLGGVLAQHLGYGSLGWAALAWASYQQAASSWYWDAVIRQGNNKKHPARGLV